MIFLIICMSMSRPVHKCEFDGGESNKNIIDVIDPFPDIFDTFDSLFFLFFLIIDHF